MKKKNFMEDAAVYQTYDRWINSPSAFSAHFLDRERFYRFVKSCVGYVKSIKFVKREEAWKSIDMDILKEHLCADLAELRKQNYAAYEERLYEILIKFEMLLEYEKIK